jgi:serine/threonine protein kinase
MTNFVGQSLQDGKYFLQREVGRGSFGIIYQAIDSILKQRVAIKILDRSFRQHPKFIDFVAQFQGEAIGLAKCSHKNIVGIKDFFIEKELPHIVMDYIPGITLHEIVLPNNPLSSIKAISYIRQVGEALKTVHLQGLLHKDIKPKNLIFCRNTQQVILIDFGIAQDFSNQKLKTSYNLVSEGYAPIEQYLSHVKLTPTTDVYGLAATLYTLLTARIPASAMSRSHYPLETPHQICPTIDEEISFAVMSGMALEASDRPASVSEWLDLLPDYRLRSIFSVNSKLINPGKLTKYCTTELDEQTLTTIATTFKRVNNPKPPAKILAGAFILSLGALLSSRSFLVEPVKFYPDAINLYSHKLLLDRKISFKDFRPVKPQVKQKNTQILPQPHNLKVDISSSKLSLQFKKALKG